MGSKLTLSLPNSVSGLRAPASILDENLAVVRQTTLGAPASDIELDPGIYAARAVLPDGRCFEAAFEVPAAANVTDVVLRAAPRPVVSLGQAGSVRINAFLPNLESFRGQVASGDSSVVYSRTLHRDAFDEDSDGAEDGGSVEGASADYVSDETRSLALVTLDASGRVLSEDFLEADPSGFVLIDRQDASRFIRVARDGEPDFFVAAPTSAAEGVKIRVSPGMPPDFKVTLEDNQADMLLRYLGSGRLEQLALLVRDYWSRAESLLSDDDVRPIAATVGAYVILLVGPPSVEDADYLHPGNWLDRWTELLFQRSRWIVDGLCIRAELLARQGNHIQALDLLLELPVSGLPMFSGGLRFALNRLTSYRHAAITGKLARGYVEKTDAVLDTLYRTAAGTDFDCPILAFEALSGRASEAAQWPREQPRSSTEMNQRD
jgi:hypothetical protein